MADSLDKNSWDKPEEATPRSSSIGVQNRAQLNQAQFNTGQPDESPELLRWRADSLLDEMMLGAVDVSAADAGAGIGDATADGSAADYSRYNNGHGHGYGDANPYSSYPGRDARPEDRYGEGTGEPRGSREPYENQPDENHYGFERETFEHGGFDPDRVDRDGPGRGDYRGFDDAYRHDGYPHDAYPRDAYPHDPHDHSNGEPRFRDEAERTRDREGGVSSSLPPLSMPDLGLDSSGLNNSVFQWREEKNGANGNGSYAHPANGSEPRGPEPTGRDPNGLGDTYSHEAGHEAHGHEADGHGQRPGYTPPTIPPPRDGGRPAIRSGGISDSTPRSSLAADFSGSLNSITGHSITGSPAPHTPAPLMGSSPASSGGPRIYGASERYEQFAAEQNRQRAAPVETPPPPETTKWEWQDFSQPTQPPPGEVMGSAAPAAASGDTTFVSAMSIPGSGKKRSTLLPRMTNVDAEAVNQEIATLHAELMRLLPNGHEAGERARHLLEKAHSILQTDPMREAEVEYYMQQVRAIAQRVQQTRQWSDLYRDRLRLYLAAWMMLSLIVVAARLMFPIDVEGFVFGLTGGAASAALLAHYVGGLTATFAGSLGGSLGALATMVQHARREYGFFDRKYGLRGLMLPIIGWLFGALLYAVAALIFSLMGIVPAANPIAAAIPAVGAFLFGVSQESIYGTRS